MSDQPRLDIIIAPAVSSGTTSYGRAPQFRPDPRRSCRTQWGCILWPTELVQSIVIHRVAFSRGYVVLQLIDRALLEFWCSTTLAPQHKHLTEDKRSVQNDGCGSGSAP